MAGPVLDFWYDFASVYSYLSAMRIAPLAEAAGVTVRWRPFLLGPVFQKQGMADSPVKLFPLKGAYIARDMERLAADLGVGFVWPATFPQSGVLAARVALVGLDSGWGEEFSRRVYTAQFADGRVISEPATIAGVLAALELPAEATLAQAEADTNRAKLRTNTAEALDRGLFGGPSFTCADGEMFWDNDRLEQALRWAVRTAG